MSKEVTIKKQCPYCGHFSDIIVKEEDYNRWKNGELIQVIWPDSTPDWREQLKTGIHSKCWDDIFPDD